MGEQAVRYRPAPPGSLAIVAVPPLTAVFDRRSGQTHLLASPLPECLQALADDARDGASAAHLLTRLSDRFDIGGHDGEAAVAVIEERLDELVALGLADRDGPCVTR